MSKSNKLNPVQHMEEMEMIRPGADARHCFERKPYQYPDVSEIIKKMRGEVADGEE